MASIKRDWGVAMTEIFDTLIPSYILGGPNSETVIERIFKEHPEMIYRGMLITLTQREGSAVDVLMLSQKLNITLQLLDSIPSGHAFELILLGLSLGTQGIDSQLLDGWLDNQLAMHRGTMIQVKPKP